MLGRVVEGDCNFLHSTHHRTQWFCRTNALETIKAAFSVTVIAQEHILYCIVLYCIQTNGDGKSGINLSALCYLTLFYH
jgi:hypothetical protein